MMKTKKPAWRLVEEALTPLDLRLWRDEGEDESSSKRTIAVVSAMKMKMKLKTLNDRLIKFDLIHCP